MLATMQELSDFALPYGVTRDLNAQVSHTQQNQCAVALPLRWVYVFQLPMGKVLHVDAVYPPVAIARHTDDHEF